MSGRQITKVDEWVGETIAYLAFCGGDQMFIRFESGNHAYLQAMHGYEGDVELECDTKLDIFQLKNMGVITPEEYETRCAEVRTKNDKEQEIKERAELRRLRLKYNKTGVNDPENSGTVNGTV